MRIRYAFLTIAVALALLAIPALRANAGSVSQQQGLGITVRAGFGDDQSYVTNEWFPVRVLLTNPTGAPSMRVRVEVSSIGQNGNAAGSYAREVDLPSPSRKDVTLYAYGSEFNSSFTLRVMQGDTTIGSKAITMNPLEQGSDTIVGVLSSDASLLNVLRGERVGHVPEFFINTNYYPGPPPTSPPAGARVTVAHMTADDIPALSAALGGLSVLILDDADTSTLTEEQQASLAGWVTRGGMLIIAARPGGADISAAIADMLPVQINGTRSLNSLQGLGDLVSSPITPTSSVLATNSTLRAGKDDRARLLASQEGVPLVAMRDVGEGHVAYLALSPGLAPLKTWDGLVPLFERLTVEYKVGSTSSALGTGLGSYSYGYSGYSSSTYSMFSTGGIFNTFGGLFDLPSLDLPEPLGIGIFLLVYVILIGPINFIVLRRLRRAELAWITIPVMVLIFSVGAYLIGYQSKGGELIMIRANTVHSIPGAQQANARQFMGLFSPLRSTLRVTVNTNAAVSELNPDEYNGGSNNNPARVVGNSGNSTSLDNLIINTSSLRSFVSEDTVKSEPLIEADLRLADNLIVGTLRNRTNNALQDVALIRGDAVQYIGYMGAGNTTQVTLTVSTRAFDNGTSSTLLPPPSGVTGYSSGGSYYYGGSSASSEQREYNRKVQLLNIGLTPLLSNEAPTDMDVLAIAWGANSPVNVSVEGHLAQTEDINLWTSRLPVAESTGSEQSSLKVGAVPFWTYFPNGEPTWHSHLPSSMVSLDPYADMHFQLPAGAKPDKLSLVTNWPLPDAVDLLAYNVQTGKWDRLIGPADGAQSSTASLSLPSPEAYTGPAGDVTIRLLSRSGKISVPLSTFGLQFN